jgi:nitrogen regulatory protein PII
MKKIEAVIQPHKLEEVKEALKSAGAEGMTISEVRGHGRQKGHTEAYRGAEYRVDLLPKIKLELVVADANLNHILDVLGTSAKSGRIGDGKIFVSTIDDVIRIRNGDRGEAAL